MVLLFFSTETVKPFSIIILKKKKYEEGEKKEKMLKKVSEVSPITAAMFGILLGMTISIAISITNGTVAETISSIHILSYAVWYCVYFGRNSQFFTKNGWDQKIALSWSLFWTLLIVLSLYADFPFRIGI